MKRIALSPLLSLLLLCACATNHVTTNPAPNTGTVGATSVAAAATATSFSPTMPPALATNTPSTVEGISPNPLLLESFSRRYPAAGQLIEQFPAVKSVVQELANTGVIFGGAANDGPSAYLGTSYNVGLTIYVAPNGDDALHQLRDFLYTSIIASSQPDAPTIYHQALSGALTADQYVFAIVSRQAHASMTTAKAYQPIRTSLSASKRTYYDRIFSQDYYSAIQSGKMTFNQLVSILMEVHFADSGVLQNETDEDYLRNAYRCFTDAQRAGTLDSPDLDMCYTTPTK